MNELEQRVQALEQELQILKNQIQAILLDIQEQVLSNTYPGLRTSDSPPQDNPPPARPRPEPEEPVRPSPAVRKVSFNDLNDNYVDEDDDQPMPEQPQVRSKKRQNRSENFNDFNDGYADDNNNNGHHMSEQPPARPRMRRNRDEATNENDHWQVMADLEEWAKKKIEVIGAQQTADLIRTNTIKGRFTPEERDALIDFVVMHITSYPDAPTQPSRPIPFDVTARPPKNARAQAVPTPSVQPPARPVENTAQQSKPARTKAAPANPVTAETTVVNKPRPPKPDQTPKDKGSMVLRLIAGVQNAGAGVRWGKNDG